MRNVCHRVLDRLDSLRMTEVVLRDSLRPAESCDDRWDRIRNLQHALQIRVRQTRQLRVVFFKNLWIGGAAQKNSEQRLFLRTAFRKHHRIEDATQYAQTRFPRGQKTEAVERNTDGLAWISKSDLHHRRGPDGVQLRC